MITELKPTNLIAVEVGDNIIDYKISGANYLCLKDTSWFPECPLSGEHKILGNVTKDKIGFDVTPFLRKIIDTNEPVYYKFYNNEGVIATTDERKSFYSLLAANGLYFENPIIKSTVTAWWEAAEWHSYEEKLIRGKLLIIEKL